MKIKWLVNSGEYGKKGDIDIISKKQEKDKEFMKTLKELEKKGGLKIIKEKKPKKKPKTKDINDNVNVKENTSTPTLPTTHYYIKSWGYYNKYKKIIIEQINPNQFLYNINGKKGLSLVQEVGDKQKGLIIEGSLFIFSKKQISPAYQFYNVPSLFLVEKYLKGQYKPRQFKVIYKDILNVLKQMFDFPSEIDVNIASLTIGQSWIKLILNEFFFFGIDSSKGGGKTTLGELVYFLMRHGFVGGNITSAAIPRLVDELDLNIFVDEIDQSKKDDDIMGVLRKGQRVGNPYVRCEGRENYPVAYNVAGCHGFSYRSEVEDAFMDRALRVHTSKSNDYMLPVINSSKKEILKPLADELFLWFIDNIHVEGCSGENGCRSKKYIPNIFLEKVFNRQDIYKNLTENLGDDERKYLKQVFGRDNELMFLCLKTSKLLGFDMVEDIKKIIDKKKSDAASSEGFYFETLKEFFILNDKTFFDDNKKLKEGDNEGCWYFPKNKTYQMFVKHLKEMKVKSIGTKKFSSYLRDIGFVEGISITSQRYDKTPLPCLIFVDSVLKVLGTSKAKIEADRLVKEFPE